MSKTNETPEGHIVCPTCYGKGEVIYSCCTGEVVDDDLAICPKCHEHLGEETCEDCEGEGYVSEDKEDFSDKVEGLNSLSERHMDSSKEE